MSQPLENPFKQIEDLINFRFDVLEQILKRGITSAIKEIDQQRAAPPRKVIGTERAAELLGVSLSSIYQWTYRNAIPFYKNGNKLYFFEDELLQWVANGKM